MLLGDYGADVIKIEHPQGDPARTTAEEGRARPVVEGHRAQQARRDARRRDARGQDLLLRLVRDADVLIENFRPGVMERWGLGPEQLHEANPRLVMLRVTGFGQTGPYAERRAFGTLAEAMSGLAHMTGQPDGPPTLPPFGLADGVAGITGALAVMLALYHRDTDGGTGQVIDLSLLEPLLGILGPGPSAYDQLGVVPGRNGNRSTNNAPRNTYLTRDGRWVAISASATSVASRVMHLVGRPDLAEQPWFGSAGERVTHGDEIDDAVAAWILGRDLDEVMARSRRPGQRWRRSTTSRSWSTTRRSSPARPSRRSPTRTSDRCACRTCCSASPHAWLHPLHRARARPGHRGGLRGAAGTGAGEGRPAARGGGALMQRSYLFAPGHNAKLLRKVFDAGADAVMLDLEDAVPPDAKTMARLMVAEVLADRPAWVRVNAPGTPWCEADLEAVAGRAAGIRIPKAESAEDVQWVADRSPAVPLICAIETARGVLAAPRSRPYAACRTSPWAASTCAGT